MYVKESEFEYKGFKCVVIFWDSMYRCGYVQIPPYHYLYGKTQSDRLPILWTEMNGEIGKRGVIPIMAAMLGQDEYVSISAYFEVHGGITYCGCELTFDDEHHWWIGFDCYHAGDKRDIISAEYYWTDNEKIASKIEFEKEFEKEHESYGVARDLDYVQDECMSLVDQIIELCAKLEVAEMDSIITKYTDECLLCGANREAMHHCIPGTANRAKSDMHKLIVPLCNFHHNLGPNSAHTNTALGNALKIIGQLAFEKEYYRKECKYGDDPAREKFLEEFGRSFV